MSTQSRGVTLRQLTLQESMNIAAGVRPVVGWTEDFPQRGDIAATRYTSSQLDTAALPWSASWLIIANDLAVGTIGFKGEPRDGELVVGYGVVPSWQRRGVATSALAQLLDLVREYRMAITAETAVENVASQHVVKNLGFTKVDRRENEDGEVIVWRREPLA